MPREMWETSASPALPLPSSKATYICHNEEWAIFYQQAAFNHKRKMRFVHADSYSQFYTPAFYSTLQLAFPGHRALYTSN